MVVDKEVPRRDRSTEQLSVQCYLDDLKTGRREPVEAREEESCCLLGTNSRDYVFSLMLFAVNPSPRVDLHSRRPGTRVRHLDMSRGFLYY